MTRPIVLALAAAALLSACASGPPAPVEDRSSAGAAAGDAGAAAQVGAPGAGSAAADGAGDDSVRVGVLPESGPTTVRALPSDPEPGAVSAAPAPRSAAVVALVERADGEARAGRHANAAATLERALKIEPADARLWHRLAAERLAQGRPGEAASLAAKSNSLAAGDRALQAANWRLIARVHRQRGEDVAARAAEEKARALHAPPS